MMGKANTNKHIVFKVVYVELEKKKKKKKKKS